MSERSPSGEEAATDPLSLDDLVDYVRDVMDWNSYQAAAYVAVVREGPLEPKDIVAMTEIPQGRVYDVMGALEGDVVNVQGRQPKRYQAQHPRLVLGDKQEAFNEKADEATDHLEQQYEIQRERQDPMHPAWVIPGMAGVKREIREGLSTASDQVRMLDRDGSWIQRNEIRDLGRLVTAGVDVEVIGRPRWREKLTRLAEEASCRVWVHEVVDSSFAIVDEELLIMRTGRGKTGVKIEDSGTVKVLQAAFEASREEATEIQPHA